MKNIRISDIAKKLNVSTATVSRALNNKEGVGEKTRRGVIALANELDYKVNFNAKAIRKEFNVLVIFPIKDKNSKYYTDLLWEGYQQGKSEFDDAKINFHELYYSGSSFEEVDRKYLKKLNELKLKDVKIDAAIIYIVGSNKKISSYINNLFDLNIPIIALHKLKYDIKANIIVTDQAEKIGRLAVEMMTYFNKNISNILLIENKNETFFGEDKTSKGFVDYISSYKKNINLYRFDQFEKKLGKKIRDIFKTVNIDACFATTARSSIYLANIIKFLNYQDKVFFICAGRNKASESFLKDGVCKCIIDNNPILEGKEAVRVAINSLINNSSYQKNEEKFQMVKKEIECRIIFKSNM
ncbi:LacI family DNA-binding transcriptional regulator [Anaerococcus sp. WCA-380-WT-2B]|uniref:LacI family DNA-binding transcriptional regulator n=1 Tax=Anaerococcus porci TaxID=2652269 RepID=A0A6N7VE92_9FIRM|nr:LacI family DNA-binding transcriptional regulator [Anaerococcus porci]MSS77760.1 LacI family DNA-binding transcriptional regulator [Anaerococcus porci]